MKSENLKDLKSLTMEQTVQWFRESEITKSTKYKELVENVKFANDSKNDTEILIKQLSSFLYVVDKELFYYYNSALKKELDLMRQKYYVSLYNMGIFPNDLRSFLNKAGDTLTNTTELVYPQEDIEIMCKLGDILSFDDALFVWELINRRIPGLLDLENIFVRDAKLAIDDILCIAKNQKK